MSRDIDDLRHPEWSPCPFCGQLHGTACNGVDQERPVVHHAQQCDWRSVLRNPYIPDWQTTMTFSREWGERLADYIERLERENAMMREEFPCDGILDCVRCEHRVSPDECEVIEINAKHKAERDALRKEHDALLAEHDAFVCFLRRPTNQEREHHLRHHRMADDLVRGRRAAYDNAESMMHDE